uniref:Cid3 n=1 Tax=Drosophila vulcana TaxID=132243 RepID=A0A1V0HRN1_9MUSC|nr:Cid3 [Drosophila vulcana]
MKPLQPTGHQGAGDSNGNNENASFRTPEASESATDYGLEFSTTRLLSQNANNRRSSTLRSPNNIEHQEDQENPSSSARPQRTLRQNSEGGEVGAVEPSTRRRKQRGPMSRAARMNREIRRLRACTTLLIPRLPFSRLVRELIMKYASTSVRITETALRALQESSELYLTQRFEDAYLLTHHRGRVTLEVRDMGLMAYLIDKRS